MKIISQIVEVLQNEHHAYTTYMEGHHLYGYKFRD